MSYKQKKVSELRAMVRKYEGIAKAFEAYGHYEEAKQYHRTAMAYSDQLVKIHRERKSSWQIYRQDRRESYAFEKMYPGSIELFA